MTTYRPTAYLIDSFSFVGVFPKTSQVLRSLAMTLDHTHQGTPYTALLDAGYELQYYAGAEGRVNMLANNLCQILRADITEPVSGPALVTARNFEVLAANPSRQMRALLHDLTHDTADFDVETAIRANPEMTVNRMLFKLRNINDPEEFRDLKGRLYTALIKAGSEGCLGDPAEITQLFSRAVEAEGLEDTLL